MSLQYAPSNNPCAIKAAKSTKTRHCFIVLHTFYGCYCPNLQLPGSLILSLVNKSKCNPVSIKFLFFIFRPKIINNSPHLLEGVVFIWLLISIYLFIYYESRAQCGAIKDKNACTYIHNDLLISDVTMHINFVAVYSWLVSEYFLNGRPTSAHQRPLSAVEMFTYNTS